MAITVTIAGTTAPQRARALPAWGDFLHPGRDATAAEVEAYLLNILKQVVYDYEHKLSLAAIQAPAELDQ